MISGISHKSIKIYETAQQNKIQHCKINHKLMSLVMQIDTACATYYAGGLVGIKLALGQQYKNHRTIQNILFYETIAH